MNFSVLGVLALMSFVLMPFVFGGEINFLLSEPDVNATQYNEEIPTNWVYSGVKKDLLVGSTYFVSPLGQLTSGLDSGFIYEVEHDGNLLLSVNSINESSCNIFADVSGLSFELNSVETKTISVITGQKFGLKFTVTNLSDENCSLNFDLNKQWME